MNGNVTDVITQIDIGLYSLPLAPIVAVVATYSMAASDNS